MGRSRPRIRPACSRWSGGPRCTSTACSSRCPKSARPARSPTATWCSARAPRASWGSPPTRGTSIGSRPSRAASTARPASTARTGRSTSAPTTGRSTHSTRRRAPSAGPTTARGRSSAPRSWGPILVYAASATDWVVALDPATGKWRWQYEREMPEGFTIHGYAGPRLHGNELLAGFADGYFVALGAANGEVLWARSLATASEQFVDVDTTPALLGELAYVASYSGGLCAIDSARRRHQVAPRRRGGRRRQRRRRASLLRGAPAGAACRRFSTGTSSGARG